MIVIFISAVIEADAPGVAALKRKGKGDDVAEDDMGAVVHAHNSKPMPRILH
jgi:hypothetical protein